MIVSINQPAYLPWLGYFHRIAASDLHIVLDHVQFEKNSFTNRNKIRTAAGPCWLTVPVRTGGRFGELPIMNVEIAEPAWRRKHWDSLRFAYAKAPFFRDHQHFFRGVYERDWPLLMPLQTEITGRLCAAFDIATPRISSSELRVQGRKGDLVLALCRAVGATTYLSGPLGRDYLDPDAFAAAGIRLAFHDYRHPEYRQVSPGFEPFMAGPDLLFNHGPQSGAILRSGQVAIAAAA
ncbi:MAG: WbqC family protein [Alphaproteobacteria bacterium]|nr:WbqC family protein [Alphaproteobacteria bacterium]